MQKHLAIIINVDWYFNLHWYNRAKAAKEKGYRVSIITSFTAPRLKLQWESEGYDCYDIKISRSGILIFEEVASIYHLYKIIKKIKPDLVHSVTIKPNIYTGLISKALKIPCVKSITGLGVVFSNNSYKFRAIKTVIVLLYKYIGRTNQGPFLFENSEDKLLFQRNGIGRSDQLIQVNGAGVDTNKYQSRKEILTEPQITVLFAARLLKDKGLDTLISSINHCRQIGMDIRLIVAGIFDLESNNAYSQDEVEYLSQKHDFNWVGTIEDMPIS
ncbi:UDP-N-acetylgalactosaminyltransferase [Vibrio ishigakensis]|uniref:UDP-N-acetylgalactosaminyltransferase n=1 Tax=Vibrio ishigakensis TaxID=1481914 RepID=A0A0B8NVC7_9VIBR|nr:UDP-N-acetylgalactosaminyltransferase [Vibrio ishigakensis]